MRFSRRGAIQIHHLYLFTFIVHVCENAFVQVTVGTPVFGELQKDDVILEIQNCDASRLTHKQAQDMVRNSGGSMLLRVRRSGLHFLLPVS